MFAVLAPLVSRAEQAGPSSAASPAVAMPPLGPDAQELRSLADSGALVDLRWPSYVEDRAAVSEFYRAGGYALAWVHDNQPTPQALAMIESFKQAALKGLNPEDYGASRWDGRIAAMKQSAANTDGDRAHVDLALTVCAMRYLSDLHLGRVNPHHFKFGLDVGTREYDLAQLIRSKVINAVDMNAAIAEVEPPFAGYRRAEGALLTYMKLAADGDSPPVPVPDKGVRPGQPYPALAILAARLRQLGDLGADAAVPSEPPRYQGAIVDAVRHFQMRHGLEEDGVVGKDTVKQLNVPLRRRVVQLQLTLERYRWLPPNFPQPPIVVNIPQFRLRTMRRQGGGFMSMKVVVGRALRTQTPVFANYMRYVVFRPYWNVPLSIQRGELVPKIRRDPDYLEDHAYEVVNSHGHVITDGPVSDDIMSGLRSGALSIRQRPGPKNALGLIKFLFPNSYNVYLHSTPVPELFARARRDFSHGCIRVEHPVELAVWVLRDKPGWTEERIREAMDGDRTFQVTLDKPIPVLILYSTAVVSPDGTVHFFSDIYGHDASLESVLARGYPYPH